MKLFSESHHSSSVILPLSVISVLIYSIYLYYIWTLFENDRHFSHLGELEREMSFRSEMALYYRYYKIFTRSVEVEDDTKMNNWTIIYEELFNDRSSQAPNSVNAFSQYSILPEVLAGIGYRLFATNVLDRYSLWDKFKQCWIIDRIEDHPQDDPNDWPKIESCEGIGDQFYFYLHFVFTLNSMTPVLLFLTSFFQSGQSYLAALFTVAMFAFNQSNCSRVQWAPPLRESFGYPLWLWNNLLITRTLLLPRESFSLSKLIQLWLVIVLQLCCWQFSSFILLIQFGSLYLTLELFPSTIFHQVSAESYDFRKSLLSKYSLISVCSCLFHSLIVQYPNLFVLESFYFAFCCSYLLLRLLSRFVPINRSNRTITNQLFQLFLLIFLACFIKFILINSISSFIVPTAENREKIVGETDDFHIWSILAVKLGLNLETFSNFHTQLYICAKEFDFMSWIGEWSPMFSTLVLPTAVLGLVIQLIQNYRQNCRTSRLSDLVRYQLSLTTAFMVLATMVMRLKILFIPQLCLVSGLVFSEQHEEKSYDNETSTSKVSVVQSKNRLKNRTKLNKSFVMPTIPDKGSANSGNPIQSKRILVFALLITVSAFTGVERIRSDLSIVGEFSNPPLEELIEFINTRQIGYPDDIFAGMCFVVSIWAPILFQYNFQTSRWRYYIFELRVIVFIGSMSTMANLLLSTGRRIANNPFYESASMRSRTYQIYQLYSSRDPVLVHSSLRNLSITFVVLEKGYCYGRLGSTGAPNCRMSQIWKLEDDRLLKSAPPSLSQSKTKRKPICELLFEKEYNEDLDLESGPNHTKDPIDRLFKLVYYNDYYSLFRVL